MDFIERLFHLSPDGGNGALETVLLAVIVGAPLTVLLIRECLLILRIPGLGKGGK